VADDLFEPLAARNAQFWVVFLVTGALLLAVAAGLGWAAWQLPGILAELGIAQGGP
jgi:hypothetical protein